MNERLNQNRETEDLFRLGQHYEGLNRFEDAIQEYRKSLGVEFKKDVLVRLIQLCRLIGENELIEECVLKGLKSIHEDDLYFRNILLNELEMAQGKIVLSTKVRSLTITLTNKCNLNCLDCEARRYAWEMPLQAIKEIIGLFPYLEYIMWQGGEVFLMDYFQDILEEARRYPDMKQLIVTNAMLLSEDVIEKLVRQPELVLAISVDGATKDIYEHIRRGAKFDRLIENIKLINLLRKRHNSNTRLHLNVTVMRSNYRQLLDFIEFAKEYGFYSVLLRPVQGNRDSGENIFIHQNGEEMRFIDGVIDELNARAGRYQIILDNRLPRLSTAPRENTSGDKKTKNTKLLCYAPWQRLYISWGGNVYPDCMCVWPHDKGIANITRDSLKAIWNNKDMQTYREKLVNNDYRDLCSQDCISGCVPERYLQFNK